MNIAVAVGAETHKDAQIRRFTHDDMFNMFKETKTEADQRTMTQNITDGRAINICTNVCSSSPQAQRKWIFETEEVCRMKGGI